MRHSQVNLSFSPPSSQSHIWVRYIQFQLRQDNNNSNFRLRLKVKILFQSRVRRNIFYIYSRFRYFRRTFLDIGYYENYNTYKTFNAQCSGNCCLINILSNDILGMYTVIKFLQHNRDSTFLKTISWKGFMIIL